MGNALQMSSGFAEFMFKHRIPATAAAFSIGGASAEMAKALAHSILIPTLAKTFARVAGRGAAKAPAIEWRPFGESLLSWACVVVTSYVLMELLFARTLLGASTVVLNDSEKAEMEAARKEAAKPITEAAATVKKLIGTTPVGVPSMESDADELFPLNPADGSLSQLS